LFFGHNAWITDITSTIQHSMLANIQAIDSALHAACLLSATTCDDSYSQWIQLLKLVATATYKLIE
jgi:hypothetical protein